MWFDFDRQISSNSHYEFVHMINCSFHIYWYTQIYVQVCDVKVFCSGGTSEQLVVTC